MDFQCCLHLVHDGECLLRFFSKPCGDGAPSDLGLVAMASGGLWQRLAAEDYGSFSAWRFQGPVCNFFVF
jgi:hypothetical protein